MRTTIPRFNEDNLAQNKRLDSGWAGGARLLSGCQLLASATGASRVWWAAGEVRMAIAQAGV